MVRAPHRSLSAAECRPPCRSFTPSLLVVGCLSLRGRLRVARGFILAYSSRRGAPDDRQAQCQPQADGAIRLRAGVVVVGGVRLAPRRQSGPYMQPASPTGSGWCRDLSAPQVHKTLCLTTKHLWCPGFRVTPLARGALALAAAPRRRQGVGDPATRCRPWCASQGPSLLFPPTAARARDPRAPGRRTEGGHQGSFVVRHNVLCTRRTQPSDARASILLIRVTAGALLHSRPRHRATSWRLQAQDRRSLAERLA